MNTGCLYEMQMKNASSYCKYFQKQSKSTQQEIVRRQEWGFLTMAAAVGEGRGKLYPPISGADRDRK
jgi:hypothetical protein